MSDFDTKTINNKQCDNNGNGVFVGSRSKLVLIRKRIADQWNSDTHTGSVFRNMAKLATGTGLAKLIGFITAPIITRIYLPEHFGMLSVFVALAALLVPFGTLRYSMAIPLPRHDGAAINLAVLSVILLFCFSVFAFFFFWLFSPVVLGVLSMEQLLPYWWLLPMVIAGAGMYELLTNWAIRERAFKSLAKTQVWQQVLGASVKIGLGLLGFKPVGLLIGQIFSEAGGVVSLLRSFFKKFSANIRHVSKKRMQFFIRRYFDFPKFRLPSQFLLVIAIKAPLLYFAWQFGADTTGQLGLALTILALPINLLGQTTGKAYYGEIASIGRKNPDRIYNLTKSIIKRLFIVSILPFLALFLFGPSLFQFVFGDIWSEAGTYASILAVYLLSQFIASPLVNVFNVFEKQKMYLTLNSVRIVILFIIFILSYTLELSPSHTIIIYSLVLTLYYLYISFMVFMVIYKEKIQNARSV
jgi:O-antigen/teichoic acid export membrane protein